MTRSSDSTMGRTAAAANPSQARPDRATEIAETISEPPQAGPKGEIQGRIE